MKTATLKIAKVLMYRQLHSTPYVAVEIVDYASVRQKK